MINALFETVSGAVVALFFAALLLEPATPTPRHEICSEISFEQQGTQTVPRGTTEACQTRATGDAQ